MYRDETACPRIRKGDLLDWRFAWSVPIVGGISGKVEPTALVQKEHKI